MRSDKARRAALSWERMAACQPESAHFQVAEGHTMGLPFPWLLPLGKQRK
jgi:hypothetical protein